MARAHTCAHAVAKSVCRVNQLPADLPKVDFAALKKQLPDFASTIDALQKQYESLKIPYGSVPADLRAEVDKWSQYTVSCSPSA